MADTEPERDWLKITRRILTGICAVGAVVASFVFITDLALQTDWPLWVAWILPLCIDALGAMALVQYRTTRDATAARVGIGAITFSALCNAASHWYSAGFLAGNQWFSTGMLTPDFVIVTIVGSVPAISLGICVHLITKEPRHAARAAVVKSAGGDTGDTPDARPDAAIGGVGQRPRNRTPAKTPRAKSRVSADRAAQARRIIDQGWLDKTWDELVDLLPAGRVQAGEARKLAREMQAASGNGNATLVE